MGVPVTVVVPEPFKVLWVTDEERPIVKYPSEILRQRAAPVERVNKELRQFVEQMVRAMRSANGIGLAAPQLGRSIRLIISAAQGKPRAFFNPEIVSSEGEQVGQEGCLSLPGLYGNVKRAAKVRVRYLDEENRTREETFSDLEARVMQHEIDHLDGVLFIDRVEVETLHWEWPVGARDSA